jgi:hypothetical protein
LIRKKSFHKTSKSSITKTKTATATATAAAQQQQYNDNTIYLHVKGSNIFFLRVICLQDVKT